MPTVFSAQIHQFLIPCPLGSGKFQTHSTFLTRVLIEGTYYGLLVIENVTKAFTSVEKYRNQTHKLLQTEKDLMKKNLKLAESNAELENFAYIVSHDLQAPVRHILSYCEIIKEDFENLDENLLNLLEVISRSSKKMKLMISTILDYSRIRHTSYNFKKINLWDCVDDAKEMIPLISDNVKVEVLIDELQWIEGDPVLLSQLFQNLFSNSVKFKKPDCDVKISVKSIEQEDGWQIEVTDNGIGIPQEFSSKVFQLFQRLHSEEMYSGNGIGLAFCKQIVEKHNGSIEISPKYTKGTKFIISFPKIKCESKNIEE